MLTEAEKRQLDQDGYLAFPGLMSAAWLESLRRRIDQLLEEEGDAAGSESKHEPGAGVLNRFWGRPACRLQKRRFSFAN